jgi:glycosyltransferase involved in cell wall biosynthesis
MQKVFGFVGTLNHPPNFDALEQILLRIEADAPDIRLEIVGGPAMLGEQLAKRFSSLTYLGRLSDSELVEASSRWSAFLNPIFWLSRGASFKLGTALELGLPIISTVSGARGYRIPDGCVALVDDNVDDFVAKMKLFVEQPIEAHRFREALLKSKASLSDDRERLTAFQHFLAKE